MGLQEKIFFRGVREGLVASLGVESLEALKQAQEITLHPAIYNQAAQNLRETLQDYKERLSCFRLRRGSLTVSYHTVTQGLDFLAGQEGQSIPHRRMGKANAFTTHTHPTWSKAYLEKRAMNYSGYKKEADAIQHIFKAMNYIANETIHFALSRLMEPNFSAGDPKADLDETYAYPRAASASLLVSEHGFRLIVNPNFKNRFLRRKSQAIQEYEATYKTLTEQYLNTVMKDRKEDLTEDEIKEFQKQVDEPLKKVCESHGWLLFGNDDYNSPVLQRLH